MVSLVKTWKAIASVERFSIALCRSSVAVAHSSCQHGSRGRRGRPSPGMMWKAIASGCRGAVLLVVEVLAIVADAVRLVDDARWPWSSSRMMPEVSA